MKYPNKIAVRFYLTRRHCFFNKWISIKSGSSPNQLEERAPKFGSREIQLGLYLIEIAIGIGIGIELKSTLQQAAGNLRGKDFIYLIRSLTPQQAAGNALAIAVQYSRIPRNLPLRYNPCRPID